MGIGFNLFAGDHSDMYPPAGMGGSVNMGWDSFVHPYLGGTADDADLVIGVLFQESTPKILQCPADKMSKVDWVSLPNFGIRTYSMVSPGRRWQAQYQVPNPGGAPLPDIDYGVGIYWNWQGTVADAMTARGYKSTTVQDPAGSFLLVEQPNFQGAAGNEWPCISLGIYGRGDLYQIDPSASGLSDAERNQGSALYKLHGNRFNYLFADGHVETLMVEDTVGSGSRFVPRGMWTIFRGD